MEEADLAERLATLTPLWLEPAELPLGFGGIDTIDLSNWDGSLRRPELDRLLNEGRPPRRARARTIRPGAASACRGYRWPLDEKGARAFNVQPLLGAAGSHGTTRIDRQHRTLRARRQRGGPALDVRASTPAEPPSAPQAQVTPLPSPPQIARRQR